MPIVRVQHLVKHYRVHEKESGLSGSLKSLFKRQYKQVKAVNDISFTIDPGELVGFIGPNGAGKTTTLKCLSGLLYPSSGTVQVLGFNPSDRKPAFQKQFSLVMGQKNQLWWDLPARETFNLNKEIYQVPDQEFNRTLSQLIELLDVKKILNIQVRKLSLGERMKCELIAALLHRPKVIFLDEPTIGLDVVMQKVMRDFIRAYNREFKATVILTSHYMDDVKELCDRVIVINEGIIMFDGQLSQVIEKYAHSKIVSVVFSQPVDRSSLKPFGIVKEFSHPQARLLVPRKQASVLAAKLMQEFLIEDINIEEPPIEAIIRDFFASASNHA